jgi:hypothetical protein
MNINTSKSSGDPLQTSLDFSNHKKRASSPTPLWLCVYLPNITANSLSLIANSLQPAVIYQPYKATKRICYVSNSAAELGVTQAMSLLEAQKLYKNLKAYPQVFFQEKMLIKSVAREILQFSSMVSVKYDSSILIKSEHTHTSIKEIDKLKNLICQHLNSLGLSFFIAASPVPIASLVLAKAEKNIVLCNHDALRYELNLLDVDSFLIDQENLLELHKLGIQRGAQLFSLPSSLNNKKPVSRSVYTYLDQLLGVAPTKITPMQGSFSSRHHFH